MLYYRVVKRLLMITYIYELLAKLHSLPKILRLFYKDFCTIVDKYVENSLKGEILCLT